VSEKAAWKLIYFLPPLQQAMVLPPMESTYQTFLAAYAQQDETFSSAEQ
jgi:hypothetical protein